MKSRDRLRLDDARCMLDGRGPARVANLSLGGFFVATDTPLIAGQVVALPAAGRGKGLPHLRQGGLGERARRAAPRRPARPGFGVAITRIDLADKVALVDILRRASRKPGTPGGSPAVRLKSSAVLCSQDTVCNMRGPGVHLSARAR